MSRLNDINGKVANQAMDTHMRSLGSMGRQYSSEAGLKPVLQQMVNALMAHLPSKSDDQRQLAQASIEASMKQIGPRYLYYNSEY